MSTQTIHTPPPLCTTGATGTCMQMSGQLSNARHRTSKPPQPKKYFLIEMLKIVQCKVYASILRILNPIWHGGRAVSSCLFGGGGGGHFAWTLDVSNESWNKFCSRWVFLPIQNKNWPNWFKIGCPNKNIFQYFCLDSQFLKKKKIFSEIVINWTILNLLSSFFFIFYPCKKNSKFKKKVWSVRVHCGPLHVR